MLCSDSCRRLCPKNGMPLSMLKVLEREIFSSQESHGNWYAPIEGLQEKHLQLSVNPSDLRSLAILTMRPGGVPTRIEPRLCINIDMNVLAAQHRPLSYTDHPPARQKQIAPRTSTQQAAPPPHHHALYHPRAPSPPQHQPTAPASSSELLPPPPRTISDRLID